MYFLTILRNYVKHLTKDLYFDFRLLSTVTNFRVKIFFLNKNAAADPITLSCDIFFWICYIVLVDVHKWNYKNRIFYTNKENHLFKPTLTLRHFRYFSYLITSWKLCKIIFHFGYITYSNVENFSYVYFSYNE